jgi:tetratricopeptide (TPR) repeat protein
MVQRATPLVVLVLVSAGALAQAGPSTRVSQRVGVEAPDRLGRIDFPTSGSAAAQPAFVRGVLLLHSFEYDDAREAFQEAQTTDPTFAMAYWGEAMTYNHPLWAQTAPDAARAALARLAPTAEARLARAPTAKEKDWLAAGELLYGTGEKLQRDLAYADAMRRMHEKYPDDLEVTAFYALALLGTSHDGRDMATYMKAAALVEDVHARNAEHPGAVHYLIHCYDDPIHAPLGLRYANRYAAIAPAASHALHMPSHIYFALGMWDEASTANERSARAADDRVARKQLGVDERGFHALLWLVYSYAQQGRYQEVRAVLDQIEADAAKSGSVRVRSHLALARAAWLIETRRWADAKAPVDAKGLGAGAAAANLFAVGFAALKRGDRLGAQNALQAMAVLAEGAMPSLPVAPGASGVRPPAPVAPVAPAAPGAPQTGLPAAGAANDARVPAVMAQQLEAALLFVEGRREEALVLARQASVVEDGLSFEFGPPLPVKPTHELVGELLMDLRRSREAMQEFDASLKRYPRRAVSLLGLARAATAARDQATARRAYSELQQIWQKADKSLPELKEVFAAQPNRSSR